MRWKLNNIPKLGDVKVTKTFAILPILIDDTYVWLEYVFVHSTFTHYKQYNKFGIGHMTSDWRFTHYSLIED